MIDIKRLAYLFGWALLIGLVLVHLRTLHMQAVYRITCLGEQEQQIAQAVQQQQALLSGWMEAPRRVQQCVEALGLEVCAPGEKERAQREEIELARNITSERVNEQEFGGEVLPLDEYEAL